MWRAFVKFGFIGRFVAGGAAYKALVLLVICLPLRAGDLHAGHDGVNWPYGYSASRIPIKGGATTSVGPAAFTVHSE